VEPSAAQTVIASVLTSILAIRIEFVISMDGFPIARRIVILSRPQASFARAESKAPYSGNDPARFSPQQFTSMDACAIARKSRERDRQAAVLASGDLEC
jgi:hypothetical protein